MATLLVKPFWRGVRYALALAVIVGAIAISLMNRFEVCEVVTKGAEKTTTCGPPDLTQASVLAVAAFVLAMLWPDIQELSAFGVSVKRLEQKVEAVGDTVEQVGTKVETVGTAASHISTTADFTRTGVAQLQGTLAEHSERLNEVLGRLGTLSERAVFTEPWMPPNAPWDRHFDPLRIRELLANYFGRDRQRRERARSSLANELPSREALIGALLELWRVLVERAQPSYDVSHERRPWLPDDPPRMLRALERLVSALAAGVFVDEETLLDAVLLARLLSGWQSD